ncbi:MAG: LysE family translocator [Pseudomonadota bacterium]
MDLTVWLAFAAASTALLMIPGPTVLLVLAYAMGQGKRVAVPTALGVATGDLIAMSASLAGLGALILTSATLFVALKWAGAAYLIYLGIRMILNAKGASLATAEAEGALSPRVAFGNAATVTALNPKSIAFFIAFVPQFLDPSRPLFGQSVILIATFVGLAALNALVYAIAAARLRGLIRKPVVTQWLTRFGGLTLMGMGLATATLRRSN